MLQLTFNSTACLFVNDTKWISFLLQQYSPDLILWQSSGPQDVLPILCHHKNLNYIRLGKKWIRRVKGIQTVSKEHNLLLSVSQQQQMKQQNALIVVSPQCMYDITSHLLCRPVSTSLDQIHRSRLGFSGWLASLRQTHVCLNIISS